MTVNLDLKVKQERSITMQRRPPISRPSHACVIRAHTINPHRLRPGMLTTAMHQGVDTHHFYSDQTLRDLPSCQFLEEAGQFHCHSSSGGGGCRVGKTATEQGKRTLITVQSGSKRHTSLVIPLVVLWSGLPPRPSPLNGVRSGKPHRGRNLMSSGCDRENRLVCCNARGVGSETCRFCVARQS